jgi:REP element-mobilizing transposase RayT
MSGKYKAGEREMPHFVTSTVVGWVDVFTRKCYADLILDSLKYCIKEKGLNVHAWVIMSNHIHLIISSNEKSLPDIMRDFKKYTSYAITKAIAENNGESRRAWMLNLFRFAGKSTGIKEYKFWQSDYHPVQLCTNKMIQQRLKYLHENPVRAGIVRRPEDYTYSSALDYYTTERNAIDIVHL